MKNEKDNKEKKPQKDPVQKLCDFAFTMAAIGVCTIGMCPAFAAMGLAVPLVMKSKGAQLTESQQSKNKKTIFLSAVALVFFVIDIVLAVFITNKM